MPFGEDIGLDVKIELVEEVLQQQTRKFTTALKGPASLPLSHPPRPAIPRVRPPPPLSNSLPSVAPAATPHVVDVDADVDLDLDQNGYESPDESSEE